LPRSATVLRIDSLVVDSVLKILKEENKEILYDENEELALFVKNYSVSDNYAIGHFLLDYKDIIYVRKRKNGGIITEPQEIKRCEEVKYAHFPKIKGSGELNHVIVVLGSARIAKLLSSVIEKIVRQRAFLRVRFIFTPNNEASIRNQFEDIVKIKGDDVLDAVVSGIAIRGSRLYDSHEYQKAFTGEIKHIGITLGGNWFIVNSSGRITTYKKLSDDEFINQINSIILRLLGAGAVET